MTRNYSRLDHLIISIDNALRMGSGESVERKTPKPRRLRFLKLSWMKHTAGTLPG